MLTWDELDELDGGPLAHYQIIRRNGAVVPFEPSKIAHAMMRAFLAVHGDNGCNARARLPIFGWSNSYSTLQVERCPDLVAMGGWIKQHLLSLFKSKDRTVKMWTGKLSGFFSASKANLRNAP
jgi:hypothetical protein